MASPRVLFLHGAQIPSSCSRVVPCLRCPISSIQQSIMNTRRDYRATRSQLFDSLEDGGLRSSAPYASSAEIAEQENERSLGELHDRVNILKRLTGDIHEEVESHNKLLEGMGNAMDVSRSLMAGTMDRFTRAFETKSSRNLATIVVSCVVIFLLVYYLTKS